MISLTGVTKEFAAPSGESLAILRGLSFSLQRGAQVSVVGPSGSGKSTLLALLSGLDKPTLGSIEVDGIDITQLNESQLSRFRSEKVGIVFQSFHLLGHFSALQNVLVAAEIAGLPNPRKESLAALEKVGLGDRTSHLPSRLSGGEQQRVAIARALVARPQILLCDEPTGNLDPDNATRVFAMIKDLSREISSTLLLVTHDHDLAAQLPTTVELERGSIKAIHTRDISGDRSKDRTETAEDWAQSQLRRNQP